MSAEAPPVSPPPEAPASPSLEAEALGPSPDARGPGMRARLLRAAPTLGGVALLALLAFGGGWATAQLTGDDSDRPTPASRQAAFASQAVEGLQGRVARLEAEQALVARVAAGSLAVVNLTAASEDAAGFAPALAAAQRVLPASPDLQALQPLAARGALARGVLVEAFPSAAARARGALRASGDGEALGGFSRALDRFFGRAEPEPRGVSPEAVIARAEARLAGGDLNGAVDALGALPPAAQPAFASWIDGAQRRVEIDRRLAAARLLALNHFATVSASSGPVQP